MIRSLRLNASYWKSRSIFLRRLSTVQEEIPSDKLSDEVTNSRLSMSMQLAQSKIGHVKIPPKLESAIQAILKGYPRKVLREHAESLSDLFKQRSNEVIERRTSITSIPVAYNEPESLAYLAAFFPSLYACNYRVFTELQKRLPNFTPSRILDFGSGPATTILALHYAYNEIASKNSNPPKYVSVETSDAMTSVANLLTSLVGIGEHVTQQRNVPFADEQQFNLVTASYALNEIASDTTRESMLQHLWSLTSDILVLIEPGTPEGFRQLSRARSLFVDASPLCMVSDAYIVAPCSHDKKCPILSASYTAYEWCHFIQRVEKTDIHREMTHQHTCYADEKFSYLIVRRGKRPSNSKVLGDFIVVPKQYEKYLPKDQELKASDLVTELKNTPSKDLEENKTKEIPNVEQELMSDAVSWPRVIRQPLIRTGHVVLDLCTKQGILERRVVSKSHGVDYKDARNAYWGDLWPHPFRVSKTKLKSQMTE